MSKWNRALITGASSGIGLAMAKQLADAGTDLVLVARSKDRLDALAAEVDVEAEVLVADVGDLAALATVEARIEDTAAPVDLLINNAGFGDNGPVITHDRDRMQAMVDVNITALHRLSHAAAATFAERGAGGILNVASVAAFVPAPGSATYAASKAFVLRFSEALHDEVKPHGVHVSCLCPGLTRTEFQDRGDYDMSHMPDMAWQTADEVAAAGLRAVASNQRVQVPGVQNKAMAGAVKLMPSAAIRKMTQLFDR